MIGGQIMIIFVGGKAFSVVRLNGTQWAISIVIGLISLPIGILIRLIPDEFIARCLPRKVKKSLAPDMVEAREEGKWHGARNLDFINLIKGGRIRHVRSHPEGSFA